MAKRKTDEKRVYGTGSLFKRREGGPWVGRWYAYDGRRREKSTNTTDRREAERRLRGWIAKEQLRKDGTVDPDAERYSDQGRESFERHITDYIGHCRFVSMADKLIRQKQTQLDRIRIGTKATRLVDLQPDAVVMYFADLRAKGLSARTINDYRQNLMAFIEWCVEVNRLEKNELRKGVKSLCEDDDRRYQRRALTEDELARLLEVAAPRGRRLWYLTAVLTGMRKGDLTRLRWGDINFDTGYMRVAKGKSKETHLPMHPQLMEDLQATHSERNPNRADKVFPATVASHTRARDFLRAGIAREETYRAKDGTIKTRITTENEDGHVVDLHAMRTTFATNLARTGAPQSVTARVMRHSDYRVTHKYYTRHGDDEMKAAVHQLPAIPTNAHLKTAYSGDEQVRDGPKTGDISQNRPTTDDSRSFNDIRQYEAENGDFTSKNEDARPAEAGRPDTFEAAVLQPRSLRTTAA